MEISLLIKETSLWNRRRPLQKTIANQNSELWSPVPMAASRKQLPHLRPRKHCARCHRIVRARVKHDKHSERERAFAVRCWSSSNVGSYTHEASQTWLPKHELSKDKNIMSPKWMEESPQGLRPAQRAAGNWGILKAEKVVFPGEEHIGWLCKTKLSSLVWKHTYK